MSERLLRVTEVEANPWTTEYASDGAGLDDVLDCTLSPTARWVIETAGPDDLNCRECQILVGLVETCQEGPHGEEIERVEWRPLTVVSDNAEGAYVDAWVLCEDCSGVLTPG